ncbi:hypothetical protein DL93DRAFT_767194 [Clavulina sp. PMI_390]|nr:hypothetical protein DL93DRAFT_767194 [Clavulina sp. PMI_390]
MPDLRSPSLKSMPEPTESGLILNPTLPTTSSSFLCPEDDLHPREAYLNARRRQHNVEHPSSPIVLHPRITAVDGGRSSLFHNFTLNPGGDTLVIFMDDAIIVFDLYENNEYTIDISSMLEDLSGYRMAIERFSHQNEEGALLVVNLYVLVFSIRVPLPIFFPGSNEEVALLFQPFSSQNHDARFLGTIPITQGNELTSFSLSSVYLIVAEAAPTSAILRIHDLITGEVRECNTLQVSHSSLLQ